MQTRILSLLAILISAGVALAQTAPPASGPSSRPAFRTGNLSPTYNPALPTVFLIGDSTVKNSWDRGDMGEWGWGHPIAAYFDSTKINVENQALGGTSSRSYITAGEWGRVLPLVRKGDFVIMQFGHNDGAAGKSSLKGNGDETKEVSTASGQPETQHTFGWYIRKYISDTKTKDATPIVCSLIPRNLWQNGKVQRDTGSYCTWANEATEQSGADFIDLNRLIADRFDALGQDAVKALFPSVAEHTHTNWDGSVLNAQCAVQGIRELADCSLKDYLLASPTPPVNPIGK
jgi:lysophospholipase L1-like esterase